MAKKSRVKRIGRPTKELDPNVVYRLCLLGLSQQELADTLGISLATVKNKRNPDHPSHDPEFLAAWTRGTTDADSRVALSMYEQALSGNVTAGMFILKNNRAANWQEKQHIEHSSETLSDLIGKLEDSYYEQEEELNGKETSHQH